MTSRHFLVPLDASELATAVLPVARMLAEHSDTEITLCTIVLANSDAPLEQHPGAFLNDVATRLRAGGLTVNTTIRVGKPAEEIVRLAAECGAHLILMATHGRTGVGRLVLGSVADQVVRESPIPVVLLQPGGRAVARVRTILVPIDGSAGGAVALSAAVPLARACGARLVLVRASVPLPLWIHDATLGLDTGPLIDPMWDEDSRQSAEAYVNRLTGHLKRLGLRAIGMGVSGEPGPAIAATATRVDADLIVMSTHARRGPRRTFFGSVASDLVRRTHRPVLLVRR